MKFFQLILIFSTILYLSNCGILFDTINDMYQLKCNHTLSTLSCSINNKSLECESIVHLNGTDTASFDKFGILALPKEQGYLNSSEIKYHLLQRYSMYPYYLSYAFDLNRDKTDSVDFFLYYSPTYVGNGIQVTDKICFEGLLNMFKEVTNTTNNRVKADSKDDYRYQELEFIGEISCLNHVLIHV